MEGAETVTQSGKAHAPEGRGWFPRGGGCSPQPLGAPQGRFFHPRDQAPRSQARWEEAQDCGEQQPPLRGNLRPPPQRHGEGLYPEQGRVEEAGVGGEDDQPETPQTDFSVLHSRHPRSEGAGSVPLPPVTPPSTSPCSIPPQPWVPRPDIVPCQGSPGQTPAPPAGRYLLAGASSHHGIRFLRPSALPRCGLCGTPGEGEGGDSGISLPSGATPAPTSGKPPATPTPQPQHPGVLHTGTG